MTISAELTQALERRVALTSKYPLFTFKPNPVQWRFIDHDDHKILAIIGANKVGKSTCVSTEGVSHAIGVRPYLPQDHERFRVRISDGSPIPVPNIGQVVAEDYPNGIAKVQWPMWEKWLPQGMFRVVRTERGIVREVHVDVSGFPWADRKSPLFPYSRIHFMAYEQGAKKFAGFDPHWILNDEPPPKDVWIEQMRGLVSTGGKWMGAMTLVSLDQAWIYDIFFPRKKTASRLAAGVEKRDDELSAARGKKTHVVTGSMRDNLQKADGSGGLTEKNIQEFEEDLSPEERSVRVQGERIHMVGTNWGQYFDPAIHVVPHRAPNPYNPHVMSIDPHPTKEWAILWAEFTMDDQIYFWHEELVQGTVEDFAITIKEVEAWKAIKDRRGQTIDWSLGTGNIIPKVRLIDPLSKVNERGVGKSPVQQLAEHEIYCAMWRRHNKTNRLRNVTEALKKGFGPSSQPRIQISERCEELIYEIPMYREKLPLRPETQERKGDMIKVLDDLVDCMVAIVNMPYTHQTLNQMGPREPQNREEYETAELSGGY
jgi:phage terminase large subunit-like protein